MSFSVPHPVLILAAARADYRIDAERAGTWRETP
jgi:hypothetical protein